MEVNSKWMKNKLKVRYKFITNHGWSFKWMNSMALTFVTLKLLMTIMVVLVATIFVCDFFSTTLRLGLILGLILKGVLHEIYI